MIFSSFLLSLALISQVARPEFDPRLSWKTLKTEHFWIHHPEPLADRAQDLAARAEVIWQNKTKKFRWEPAGPVHVVLSDHTDMPNGIATPLPYNTIFLYGVPPLDESSLDEYDDWLATLFTHEFTHTIHLDMAKGFNRIPRAIVGRFWVPNAAQQQWSHEGLAITYETNETTRGRGRSSFLDMFLRTMSLEDKFLGIDRATYYNDEYPFGNSAYWYGIGFHQYLESKFGRDIMIEFAHKTAAHPIPSIMNFKTSKLLRKSFHRLWAEWKAEELQKWTAFKEKAKSTFVSSSPEVKPWRLLGVPAWDSTQNRFFASVQTDDETEIREFKMDSRGQLQGRSIVPGAAAHRLSYHEEHLLYSDIKSRDPYASYFDLIVYDLRTKKSQRITHGLRLRDPFVFRNFVYLVRTDSFRSRIVRIPWSRVIETKIKKKPLRDVSAFEVVFEADGLNTISKPVGNPLSNELVFSMKKTNGNRDLFAFDLETRKLTQLTDDAANDHHPQFSEDGKIIYYSADHEFPGTDQKVSNLVGLSRATGEVRLLTNSITGVTFPAFHKDQVIAGVFRSNGYHLQSMRFTWEAAPQLTPKKQFGEATPRVFERQRDYPSSNYSIGSTLLPRYLAPIFLYTDSDIFLGAQTASYDPLGRHTWLAGAYHRFEPNRPGGFASYLYSGLSWTDLYAAFATGLNDYGRIIFASESTVFNQKYFERNFLATAGLSSQIWTSEGPLNLTLGLALFFEDRRPEFDLPSGALTGVSSSFRGFSDVRVSPEYGQTLGGRLTLKWADGFQSGYKAYSPTSGQSLGLSVEYTPELGPSDFHTLTTILSGKVFYSPWLSHVIGLNLAAGYQWLDVFYQHSFLMGGVLGEGPLTSANRQSYSLRGLPQSALRGEGIVVGALEYRLPLLRKLPGFGTAPIWLKNLHAAAFTDAGQTFTQIQDRLMAYETFGSQAQKRRFAWDRWTLSVGGEIRSDISVFYLPPLTFRAGYGHLLLLRGDSVTGEEINEFYVQAGTSF